MRAAGFDTRYYDMKPCLLYERAAATLAGQEVDVVVSQISAAGSIAYKQYKV